MLIKLGSDATTHTHLWVVPENKTPTLTPRVGGDEGEAGLGFRGSHHPSCLFFVSFLSASFLYRLLGRSKKTNDGGTKIENEVMAGASEEDLLLRV